MLSPLFSSAFSLVVCVNMCLQLASSSNVCMVYLNTRTLAHSPGLRAGWKSLSLSPWKCYRQDI